MTSEKAIMSSPQKIFQYVVVHPPLHGSSRNSKGRFPTEKKNTYIGCYKMENHEFLRKKWINFKI